MLEVWFEQWRDAHDQNGFHELLLCSMGETERKEKVVRLGHHILFQEVSPVGEALIRRLNTILEARGQ